METFSIKEALLWGWTTFKIRPWFFIGIVVIPVAVAIFTGGVAEKDSSLSWIIQLAGTVVQWWLYLGLVGIMLAVYDKRGAILSDLFKQKGALLWNYILATVLYSLIVLGGFILLIVPGIIWAIKFHYYIYLIVDKNMKPVEALKESARITAERKWTIFGFLVVAGLLNIAGVLLLGVGVLVAMPVTLLASVFVYRWLATHAQSTDTPAPVPQSV